jgi:hypothetical protein
MKGGRVPKQTQIRNVETNERWREEFRIKLGYEVVESLSCHSIHPPFSGCPQNASPKFIRKIPFTQRK